MSIACRHNDKSINQVSTCQLTESILCLTIYRIQKIFINSNSKTFVYIWKFSASGGLPDPHVCLHSCARHKMLPPTLKSWLSHWCHINIVLKFEKKNDWNRKTFSRLFKLFWYSCNCIAASWILYSVVLYCMWL